MAYAKIAAAKKLQKADDPTFTKKHRDLLCEPLGDKPVNKLPGIGSVSSKNLIENGYAKAYKVVGQYLVLDKDQTKFKKWLRETSGADRGQQVQCYNCVKECVNERL